MHSVVLSSSVKSVDLSLGKYKHTQLKIICSTKFRSEIKFHKINKILVLKVPSIYQESKIFMHMVQEWSQ